MMRTVVIIFIFVYGNADEKHVLPVPGCVVIGEECYTHSNYSYGTPIDLKRICASNNGRLAIIQNERTWKLLIEKLLKHVYTREIMLGFTLLPHSMQLTPNVDLKNMSAYWTPTKIKSSNLQQYIYSSPKDGWRWNLDRTHITQCLCQYNITTHCRIADIDDPNVIIFPCLNESIVSHNARVEIDCSPGYYLNSSKILTCRNRIWDKPRCVAGCPPPTTKSHASMIPVKTNFDIGEKIFYICEDNYYNWRDFSKTHFTLTCQNDSSWSHRDARCSSRQHFNTIIINATEIAGKKIKLKCWLPPTNITWIHNGREVANSDAFTISPQGNLLVNSNAEKIDGFYMCQTKDAENLQMGNQTYNILGSRECKAHLGSSHVSKGLFAEGKSIFLNCPQESDDNQIKWFKNEEEITNNAHEKIIVGGGLLLKRLTWRDNGTYKCQTAFSFKSNNCKYNVTYYLTVMASAKAICGVKGKNRPNFYQPWFVILQYEDDVAPFCFGALLNDRWVVTSAFCLSSLLRKRQIKGVFAQLGSGESRKKYPISLIKVHPNYSKFRNLNDIGLIRLGGDPVDFNDDVLPVCITSEDIGNVHKCVNSADLKGTLTGWSTKVTKEDDHFILDSVERNLASKIECRIVRVGDFAGDKVCTKNDDTDSTNPELDYGSSFVVAHGGKEYLLGIFTGRENDYYDYFTSIFHHYDWINQTIN